MEKLNEAYEELKRVDHLIYVSLKYTRTVDVIINILSRTVDAYALMVDSLIEYGTEQGKIMNEPESAIERAELIKEIFADDDVVVDNMQLYLLERKLLRAKNVERENEYRRHVTMKTVIEGREEIVNIDIITNYYLYQREFLSHVRTIIEGKATIAPRQQESSAPDAPAWMNGKSEIDEDEDEEDTAPPPPPTRQPLKVRPVASPPRKRAPRPKKYKIQVPKGKNPILRAPYEAEQAAKLAAKNAAKKAAAKSAPKKPAKPKAAPKKVKAVVKKAVKKRR